jgi:hypothetical protein
VLKSNGRVELTRTEAVERAVACSKDKGSFYGLGRGGRDPKARRPYDSKGRVDCSGFVSWALGFDRYQHFIGIYGVPEDWWWSTDGLYDDATDRGQLDDDQRYGPGWFRMVAASDWYDRLVVAHATPSHRQKYGNVVAVTNARAWRKRGYIVRYTRFVDG